MGKKVFNEPLSPCMKCGGNGGKNEPKVQKNTEWIYDPDKGKKVKVETLVTVQVWKPCGNCAGSGRA